MNTKRTWVSPLMCPHRICCGLHWSLVVGKERPFSIGAMERFKPMRNQLGALSLFE
ncbi:unnamed protein product [Penicillium camemberti]|uniref:Str. FM013 n=1 Tax=Penicillium camemberti (strain FM 013) TaxID=1429867 RepID=A0A0G4P3L3_PENC3|nr:unnamed protein product [Penicillium camemberti]